MIQWGEKLADCDFDEKNGETKEQWKSDFGLERTIGKIVFLIEIELAPLVTNLAVPWVFCKNIVLN